MKTINRVLFTAIVGIWILLSDPIARSQSVSQPKIPLPTKQQPDPTPPGNKPTGSGTTPSVQDPPPPDSKPTGVGTSGSFKGRSGFCLLTPTTSGQTSTIWNDRPLFIWDGSISNIELRPHNSDTVLWTAQPDSTALTLQYDGEPLSPGQTYDVIMTGTGQVPFSFTVMDAQTRDQIAAELQTLEDRAQEQGVHDRTIAFARAQYFANRGLRSDALQEAFSVLESGEDAIAIGALLTCDLQN